MLLSIYFVLEFWIWICSCFGTPIEEMEVIFKIGIIVKFLRSNYSPKDSGQTFWLDFRGVYLFVTYFVFLRYLWYTSTILLAYTRHTLLIHSSYTRHTLRLFFSMFFYLGSFFIIVLFSIDWLLFCAKMEIIVVFGGFCMSWFILWKRMQENSFSAVFTRAPLVRGYLCVSINN